MARAAEFVSAFGASGVRGRMARIGTGREWVLFSVKLFFFEFLLDGRLVMWLAKFEMGERDACLGCFCRERLGRRMVVFMKKK